MAGTLVPLESRLQFHYDFLLKAIHAGGSLGPAGALSPTEPPPPTLWATLIDTSYWTAQQATAAAAAATEIAALKAQQAELPITAMERAELEIHKDLAATARAATNAAKRKAQVALDQWKERHAGPKWVTAQKMYEQYVRLEATIQQLAHAATQAENQVETRINPLLKALTAHGAIEPMLEAQNTPKLTEYGVAATEVNEANPLLLAKLYLSGLLSKASMPEIIGTLGAFIVDRESEEKTMHPSALPNISMKVKDTLMAIDGWGQTGVKIDKQAGVESPDGYWSLTTLWVQIGSEWMDGAEAAYLASKYQLYTGNLMKGLLKLANIVNEWIAIATLKSDVDMLETLKTAQTTLVRDIVQPESLYLRLV
jgi:superfamily II RNA helicase